MRRSFREDKPDPAASDASAMNDARLLLVEDDIVSAHFLLEVLESLPASVVHASTCAEAMGATRKAVFDLWLVDANLPDGTAEALLGQLQTHRDGRTAAIALTADPFPERSDRLLAAGFLEVLAKPLEARRLQDAVRSHLPGEAVEGVPPAPGCIIDVWDDAQALHAAGGNLESVAALRSLFARELPLDHARVLGALRDGNLEELQDTLHRLKASCGFVGARGLLDAVRDLSRDPSSPQRQATFDAACRSTLAGL